MANNKGTQRAVATNKSEIVAQVPMACANETAAILFLEAQRWGDTPHCPRCGDVDVRQMMAKDGGRNARFLWNCKGCKSQYTVKVGTVMEDSAIPARHWCYAFYAACVGKKGVSALEIQRATGVSYKSALFMMHRIRFAMTPTSEQKLSGTVEFDETYVGGKPRKGQKRTDGRSVKGRRQGFADVKTPVVAGVERDGNVRARVMTDVTGVSLPEHLLSMVDTSSRLMTDEHAAYRRAGKQFASHETVNHSTNEYARGDVTTNRIEGFFANLKRQIDGTHHAVSRKHLHRYVSESAFKYNTRFIDDGARTMEAIRGAEGKRFTHKDQTNG